MTTNLPDHANTAGGIEPIATAPKTLMQKGVEKLRQHAELKQMAFDYADFITQTGACPTIYKGKPLDAVKAKRRDDVQKALDNVLGMLGDDGTETAGVPTGAAPAGQPTGGAAQIPGVPQERQAELRAIAERAMATAKGDKAKAEEIFNAEVAKRYPDLVPAAQP